MSSYSRSKSKFGVACKTLYVTSAMLPLVRTIDGFTRNFIVSIEMFAASTTNPLALRNFRSYHIHISTRVNAFGLIQYIQMNKPLPINRYSKNLICRKDANALSRKQTIRSTVCRIFHNRNRPYIPLKRFYSN